MESFMDRVAEWGGLYGPSIIISAVAILVLGRIGVGILLGIVRRLLQRSKIDDTLNKFVLSLTKIALMTFVFIAALNTLGFATTSFVAVIGAAGLAVGLALQGSLANFAAGVMLVIFRPFKAGDFVEAGGVAGVVESVSIFNTVMRTGDNKQMIIPNGNITGNNIINYSAKETRRVDLVFGIGYDDDLRKAKQILEEILKSDSRILDDPAPVIAVSELGDSSVNIICRPWVKTSDYWAVYWDLTEKVKLTFDNEGISIPFPQRDVHMYQAVSA